MRTNTRGTASVAVVGATSFCMMTALIFISVAGIYATNQSLMEMTAHRLATANGATVTFVQFRTDRFLEVESGVRIPIHLALYDALLPPEHRYLKATGNAYMDSLFGQPLAFPAGCRKE